MWPWIEKRFVTHDYGYHHLLDRPRDNPVRTRTALGMMALVFYAFLLWARGGQRHHRQDHFHISLYTITTYARFRTGLLLGPPIAYWATKRICYGLQNKDAQDLHHGLESGTIKRLPHGEFIEVHQELTEDERRSRGTDHRPAHPPLKAPLTRSRSLGWYPVRPGTGRPA